MHITSPESLGLSSERLARIAPVMQSYIDEKKLAGILTLIARRGKVAHCETYGMQDIEANKPMQVDTIFRIYSMTKTIVSVAAMMLYEENKFHLDDPVTKYIPAFKKLKVYAGPDFTGLKLVDLERDMIIRDLFIHTAGLSYGFFEDTPVDKLYRQAKVLYSENTLETMIEKLADIPLQYQPGRTWRYSVATDVLGYLIQIIANTSLDTLLEERIFKPLGMQETAFYVPEGKHDRFAVNYTLAKEGGLKVLDHPSTSQFSAPRPFLSGGGGLTSTTADYLRFAQMMLNQGHLDGTRLLSRKTVELMTLNHLRPDQMPISLGGNIFKGYGFGLGVRVLVDVAQSQMISSLGSYGWSGAANTYYWIDPQEEMVGMVMTQFMPSGHYPLSRDFRALATQAIVD